MLKRSTKDHNYPNIPGPNGFKQYTNGDRTVGSILRDLERIKKITRNRKKMLMKSEYLINFIVLTLRKKHSDHLLQATTVWVLINILKIEPNHMKNVMLSAGVPGMLYDILKSEVLRGSTRHYASELCFFICSKEGYDDLARLEKLKAQLDGGHSMTSSIESTSQVLRLNKKDGDQSEYDAGNDRMYGDDIASLDPSEISSIGPNEDDTGFVPYRISGDNLRRLDALFDAKDAPGGANLGTDVAELSYVFSEGDPLKELKDDVSIETESSWSEQSPRSIAPSEHMQVGLARYGSQEESLDGPVFPSPTFSTIGGDPSMDGLSRAGRPTGFGGMASVLPPTIPGRAKSIKSGSIISSSSSTTGFGGHPLRHGIDGLGRKGLMMGEAGISLSMRSVTSTGSYRSEPALAAAFGGKLDARSRRSHTASRSSRLHISPDKSIGNKKHRGFVKGFTQSLESGSMALAPSERQEVDPDIPASLARLDPLSLNVNRTINAIFNDEFDDDSTVNTPSLAASGDASDPNTFTRIGFKDTDDVMEYDADGGADYDKKIEKFKAERLADNAFLRRLFTYKAKLEDSQLLLKRISDVCELMDPDQSGLVTWEKFSKVLLSVAPKDLLRGDVTAFLDAQVEDPETLIDYREFSITGRALIIEAEEKRGDPPVLGWVARQKKFANTPTTYTWKNHLKWYRSRLTNSVVWLMRRAQRAIKQDAMMIEAEEFLNHVGKRAHATSYLFNQGYLALRTKASKKVSLNTLMSRALHAKRAHKKREEAMRWLVQCGLNALNRKVEVTEVEVDDGFGGTTTDVVVTVEDEKPVETQASYNMLYLLYMKKSKAKSWLYDLGRRSIIHYEKQQKELAFLTHYGRKILYQQSFQRESHEWLKERAERAYMYGMVTDEAWMKLIRIGKKGFDYLVRQEDALEWLLEKAKKSLIHVAKQDVALEGLSTRAQHTFVTMNARENAFAFMCKRVVLTRTLIKNRAAAFKYLKRLAPSAIKQNDHSGEAFKWLKARAERGKIYARKRFIAREKLKLVAGRYHFLNRRARCTFCELKELAQISKMDNFTKEWASQPANKKRLLGEIQRLSKRDALVHASRDAKQKSGEMSKEERWMLELHDAFTQLAKMMQRPLPVPRKDPEKEKEKKRDENGDTESDSDSESESESESDSSSDDSDSDSDSDTEKKPKKPKKLDKETQKLVNKVRFEASAGLGRIGFKRLLLDGKLLHLKHAVIDHIYDQIDSEGKGEISFGEIWQWFVTKAKTVDSYFKPLKFKFSDIVSPDLRAKIILLRRFADQQALQFIEH